jgi:hypothetical protein
MKSAFRSSTVVLLAYMASVSAHAAEDNGIVLKPSRSLSAQAAPVPPEGTEGWHVFVKTDGPVTATYQGSGADFNNDLYLMLDRSGKPGNDGNLANDLLVFNNHSTPLGEARNLGTFSGGTELMFRLHVNTTGDDFFTGPRSSNPDGEFHARAQDNWLPDTTLVSFEDRYNSFDRNFNDLSSSYSNTVAAIPEPESYAMLLVGLGVIGAIARRGRKNPPSRW